jgi:hypothetical protein
MSKKTYIDRVRVKSPCTEKWEQMDGNDQVRFCSHCSKTVSNLSAMGRKEALRLVQASSGDICICYLPDPENGRPLFAEHLVQLTRRRPGIMAGVMSASLSLSTFSYAQESPTPPPIDEQPAVTIEDQSFNKAEIEEEVAPEETPTADDVNKGSIEGSTWDASGKGVRGIEILLVNTGSTGDTNFETTDADGYYRFHDLEPGSYLIRITAIDGSRKAAPPIIVNAGDKLVQNLHVTVARPSETEGSRSNFAYGGGMGGAIAVVPYSLPLNEAISSGDLELTRELITKGADVNDKDKNYDDVSPLSIAVENGNVPIVRLLLEHGADVNAKDEVRRTPLMYLDSDATAELVKVLIDAGAKVKATAQDGSSVISEVMSSAEAEVLMALIRAGAPVNKADENGETPLMKASATDKFEIVKILLEAGADVDARDKSGQTAWDKTSDTTIEDLLVQYGAIASYENLIVPFASEDE